jgi:hypothetical protein
MQHINCTYIENCRSLIGVILNLDTSHDVVKVWSKCGQIHAAHIWNTIYSTRIYCHVYVCDSRRGFGLDIGFIDHFNTQLLMTLNHSAIANSHTLQITSAQKLVLSVTRRCLITASNSGDSSASALTSFLNGGSLPTAHSCNSN